MTMRPLVAVLMLLAAGTTARAETRHPCAADAIKRARPLLILHFEYGPGETPQNLSVEDRVRMLPPIRALKGNGRFDVLEVIGSIYRASYRMRFIYAQTKGDCVLMGQEILEMSDPY